MSIGNEIRNLRRSRGLTQLELAEKAHISRSYLAGVEGDRYNPSVDTLQKIAAALGTTSGVLLGEASAMELAAVDTGFTEAMAEFERRRTESSPERQISDDDIKFALFGGDGEITDAMFDEVKRFARMVKLREEAERKKE